jgi:predicted DNA-binding transcriptional regulator YafY
MARREGGSQWSLRRLRHKLGAAFGSNDWEADKPPERRPDLEQSLCEAIRQRRLIHLLYQDDLKPRIFAPYILFHARRGRVCVAGYQAALGGMRTFSLHKVQRIEITDDPFMPDPNFNSSSADFGHSGIICSVEQAQAGENA